MNWILICGSNNVYIILQNWIKGYICGSTLIYMMVFNEFFGPLLKPPLIDSWGEEKQLTGMAAPVLKSVWEILKNPKKK